MELKCAKCGTFACRTGKLDKLPEFCPMRTEDDVYKQTLDMYLKEGVIRNLAITAARVEAEGYGKWCRVEELIEFARKLGLKKLGVAFCVGLRNEARILVDVLEKNGFDVYSVACKSGSIPKEKIGLKENEKVRPMEYEPICNPVAQAILLNKAGTELNILFGLCVGHDTLFLMHSKAPVVTLAVKDRVLAHNPIGAIYATHYYKKKLYEDHIR